MSTQRPIIVRPSALLGALPAAATDPGRFALHRVHVAPDGTVTATDGRILVQIGPATEQDGSPSNQPAAGEKPALLSPESVLAVARAAAKGSRHRTPTVAVHRMDDGSASVQDVPKTCAHDSGPVENGGSFPPLADVIPARKRPSREAVVLGLSLERLRDIVAAATAALPPDKEKLAVLRFQLEPEQPGTQKAGIWSNGNDRPGTVRKPLRIDATTKDGASFLAVLCPVSMEQEEADAREAEKERRKPAGEPKPKLADGGAATEADARAREQGIAEQARGAGKP